LLNEITKVDDIILLPLRIPSARNDAGIFSVVEERYSSAPMAAMRC
jgi:hypothetical protein